MRVLFHRFIMIWSLEAERLRLDVQWENVIPSKDLIILDEAQNDPDIFPRLRHAIDMDRQRNGRFLILGSISPSLMRPVSDLLTGRLATCELSPLSVEEIGANRLDDLWLMGGFPDGGILNRPDFPTWQQNYLDLLAMRDLPVWGLPAKPTVTKRFFKMLAALHGSIWNASQIGKSLGLSYHTVNSYLEFLENAFLIRRLQPYHANIKKRLTKSPKIYWRDSGLLHSLHGILSIEQLLAQPCVGHSWEGFVIEQMVIHLQNQDIPFEGPYFFRTNDGLELDLLLFIRGILWAFEIKLTTSPALQDLARLKKMASLIGVQQMVLLCRCSEPITGNDIRIGDLPNALKWISDT
ncbi:MAG: DUF4143 domain-containing protein [candidate division KSB1 bacterium]|nr:DUF4143 domain-containing protein [candidate division KSB1 bacterium]